MGKKYGKMNGISLKLINNVAIAIAAIVTTFLLVTLYLLADRYHSVNDSTSNYIKWENDAEELENASDYLTENVRNYVIIHDKKYLDNYFKEKNDIKRRDNALLKLKESINDDYAIKALSDALNKSNELMNNEIHAMRLIVEIGGYDLDLFPEEVKSFKLNDEIYLSSDEKNDLALALVFGEDYQMAKEYIRDNVKSCVDALNKLMTDKISQASDALKAIMIFQQAIILVFIILVIAFFILHYYSVVVPLTNGINLLMNDELLKVHGVKEYKYFAKKYNEIRTKENLHNAMLEYDAEHDKLTGLYNRNGYELVCKSIDFSKSSYLLIDIDEFKYINDKYGHSVGDQVIKRVADTLFNEFGADCYITRMGGDEFSIIVPNINKYTIEVIKKKANYINSLLIIKAEETPGVTLSFGLSLGIDNDTALLLFDKADKALYETKRNGRANITVY